MRSSSSAISSRPSDVVNRGDGARNVGAEDGTRAAPSCELPEGDGGVGEQARVEPLAAGDDRLEVLDDVPDVDVHGGGDDAVALPEGDELAIGQTSADHDAVGGLAGPHVFHAEVVLIGEEVGQPAVGVASTGGVDPGGGALVEGVGPVLDAQVTAVVGVPGRGDVAGRKDAGGAGVQVFDD